MFSFSYSVRNVDMSWPEELSQIARNHKNKLKQGEAKQGRVNGSHSVTLTSLVFMRYFLVSTILFLYFKLHSSCKNNLFMYNVRFYFQTCDFLRRVVYFQRNFCKFSGISLAPDIFLVDNSQQLVLLICFFL